VRLENAFEVPATPAETFALFLDADRVVPCMPGANLVEVVDPAHWKATLSVKLGPVGLEFAADVRVREQDEAAGTATLSFSGRDTRGKGGADGTVGARLEALAGGGTLVALVTDLHFSGQAAQLGRPSVVQDVSRKMVDQFAACVRSQLQRPTLGAASPSVPPAPPTPRPVSGLSLPLRRD
jgi:carbon monoxide dehydrogenase subunit G